MASKRPRPAGLSAQIVRVTLTIGVITVIAASAVAIVGTSRVVSSRVAVADLMSLQLVEDTLLEHVATADALITKVGMVAAGHRKQSVVASDVSAIYSASGNYVDAVVVVDENLKPVAGAPVATLPPGARRAAIAALAGAHGLTRDPASGGVGNLWLAQTVPAPDGSPLVVVAKLNTRFLSALLSEAASGRRGAYLIEGEKALLWAGISGVDFRDAQWTATGGGSGDVRIATPGRVSLIGRYDQVSGLPGTNWRVVTLEPAARVSQETASALWPSALVLAVGGMVALVMAWLVARRVVAPLLTLESAALRAAGGAYVKPIEATRDDELGQVAKAFNAVALRLNALHDLSQLLASSSQVDQVLDGILSAMGHIVGPGVAVIYLLDENGRWLVPVRARGADISLAPAVDSTSDMWLARALNDTDPTPFISSGRPLADEVPGIATDETSALAAPLVSGHESLGVVVVLGHSGAEASEAELEMVRTFSAQAAVAVQNSRLFAFETESRRVAEGLRSVAEQLVRPGGLAEALASVEIIVAELFGANRAVFAVVDRASLGLPPAGDRDQEGEILGFALRVLGQSGAYRPVVVRQGDDATADATMTRFGSTEMLVVPIALDTDHGAVLLVALGGERASRRDLELADAVANEIALSLDNAYFYEQALARADSLETVFHISQAVGSSLDVKVVLNRVLDVVQKILSADAVALMTYDARKRVIATEMARGRVSPAIVERVFAPGDDVVGFVFASGQPVALWDLHTGAEGIAGDAARHGLHSMLTVPLLARGRSIGVLTVFSESEGAFNNDDMNLLQTFGSQAALAIDTARLYSREHEVASVLQDSILPGDLPEYPGLEVASVYEPAGGDAEIGGDYYDLFRDKRGAIWLAIADVCGKGVVAATKTSMIKYAVRSLVAAGFSPGRILSEVNTMVAEGGEPCDIVTLLVGRIDPSGTSIEWSSGGHPPAMVRRGTDGTIARLRATGPLLGAVAEVDYAEDSIPLANGDVLILYTDGVTEARSGNTFFGEDRVAEAVAHGSTAAETLASLQASVRRFAKEQLRDDVAVLVVRLTGTGEV